MQLPFFYIGTSAANDPEIELDEENSRHIVQVLRMRIGESIHLTDGKGQLITADIANDHKKHCRVQVRKRELTPAPKKKVVIGISLLKNVNRFEWFLEKATEIGVSTIIPLLCKRTEKEKFRKERLEGICVSAMLQSQQTRLPMLEDPMPFEKVFSIPAPVQKFIGYCDPSLEKASLSSLGPFQDSIMLIGPEGDFTPEEFVIAQANGYRAVSLGETRLRTETAAVVAASLLIL